MKFIVKFAMCTLAHLVPSPNSTRSSSNLNAFPNSQGQKCRVVCEAGNCMLRAIARQTFGLEERHEELLSALQKTMGWKYKLESFCHQNYFDFLTALHVICEGHMIRVIKSVHNGTQYNNYYLARSFNIHYSSNAIKSLNFVRHNLSKCDESIN